MLIRCKKLIWLTFKKNNASCDSNYKDKFFKSSFSWQLSVFFSLFLHSGNLFRKKAELNCF